MKLLNFVFLDFLDLDNFYSSLLLLLLTILLMLVYNNIKIDLIDNSVDFNIKMSSTIILLKP